jgi:abhydrolase domain-containing protein 17
MSAAPYWWKLVGLPLVVVIVGYVLVVLSACAMVNNALYYPNYGSRRAPTGLQKIRVGNDEIALLHLPNPNARFTLWFFHGNAEDLGDLEPFLLALRDNGYAVFAIDYPGYGHSSGRPTEASLYASARAARTHLREVLHVPADRTLIYGRSLGGGPALQIATEERPAGLILQSAFVSAFRVVTRWPLLPFDQFNNLQKISRVTCPVLVMHGRADEVIPFRHGEALFAAANEPKRSLWVGGAMHNDFNGVAGRDYWTALREFSDLCARTSARASNP